MCEGGGGGVLRGPSINIPARLDTQFRSYHAAARFSQKLDTRVENDRKNRNRLAMIKANSHPHVDTVNPQSKNLDFIEGLTQTYSYGHVPLYRGSATRRTANFILRIVRPIIFESKFRNHRAKKLDGALRKSTSFVLEFA